MLRAVGKFLKPFSVCRHLHIIEHAIGLAAAAKILEFMELFF
jgi:hypothetical protein